MPRNVRNFWIDASIDGRASDLSGGPVAKDGGFDLNVKMRKNGSISEPVRLRGAVDPISGRVWLLVMVEGHDDILIETER